MMNQRNKERKKPSFQGNPPRRAKVNERATEYPVAVLKSAAGGSLLLEARHALQAERRADVNTVGERQAARRCVIIANLLRCYRIRAWSYTSNSAEGGRCFLKRGTRFKKRGGGMQACWGAPRGKAVCHNSQSASLLSDSGLVKSAAAGCFDGVSSTKDSAAGGSLFLEAWHTLQEERRADASTPGSASRQGAWLTPRRAKATEPPSHRVGESVTSVIGF